MRSLLAYERDSWKQMPSFQAIKLRNLPRDSTKIYKNTVSYMCEVSLQTGVLEFQQ